MLSSRDEVAAFLVAIKGLIRKRRWQLVKNRDIVSLLGLTMEDVRDTLLSLQVSHYCKGPLPDLDEQRPGDVWFFLTEVLECQVEIYIKLKAHPTGDYLIVLSFHPPEHLIQRPFR